ncbi:hypothetical protein O3M35_004949 [Rhynocoris fuscipes]|uniref:Uncharacterized protein n=1 Tax=Rhynocoris fuscipes TaxID=488301 RepID=A0AAW1DI58_9HEMI
MEHLQAKRISCFEQVFCIKTDGTARFADIVAFMPNSSKAFVIDPTVRFDSNDSNLAEDVNNEMNCIYKKCMSDFTVVGVWFEAFLTQSHLRDMCWEAKEYSIMAEFLFILDSLGIINP